MSVVLQVSDTHFGTEQPAVLEAVVALAAQLRPDLVVLSGDITQRARPGQFVAAKAFVDRLGAPVLAVPGNHDIALLDLWSRLTQPYARYAAAFGEELEPVYDTPDLLVMGVNTTRPWRHKHGEVSAEQVERVAQRLRTANKRQLRLVVVHQPLAVIRERDRTNLLRGHQAAARAWAAAGADVVMGGHIHLPYVHALTGLARRLWVVQAGTAVSSRTRSGVPNSVNVLRWDAGQAAGVEPLQAAGGEPALAVMERWDYAGDVRGFVCTARTQIQPDRAGRQAGIDAVDH